jgi:hypothetical protein
MEGEQLRITAQREDCLLKMLRDQEPLAQSGTAPPYGGGVTAGGDELVDLTYFIARRPSVELHNSSCAAISGFHQHAGTEMAAKSPARGHTLENSFANVADIGASGGGRPSKKGDRWSSPFTQTRMSVHAA